MFWGGAGDMDISYIEDLPPGRQRVATALVSDTPSEIAQVWPSRQTRGRL